MGLLLFSGIGVAVLVLLTWIMGFARRPVLADAALAARLVAEALPGFRAIETALSRDGSGALVAGQDGRVALVRPFGDKFVVRPLKAPIVARAGGLLRVRPDEAMFPETALDLGEAAALHWASRL
ncbi:hypothetical protein [Sandarakinorhabdus sp. AAP62]|uniref:hypothetical protein n=1 Tax=Sandarakinorhabdus sp. AAP62 TaxID=1248916 RepID=UPI0002F7A9DB|nr:hypothetical protein [Sandarakinorhabdus sp. AAP62]